MITARVTIDGVSTAYRTDRDCGDTAAVFVHGVPGTMRDWDGLAARASAQTRVLSYDKPGFGASDKPAWFDATPEGYARHLERLLDALGIRRAHMVLHDIGGYTGLALAARDPARIAGITLIDTGVPIESRWHILARIWRTPGLGELFLRLSSPTLFRWLIHRGTVRPLPTALVERMFATMADPGTQRAILRWYRSTDIADRARAETLVRGLRGYPGPVQVLWGRLDPYLPAALAYRQRAVFPDAEIHVLDTGHWPFAERPEWVESLVLPFLARTLGPPLCASCGHVSEDA